MAVWRMIRTWFLGADEKELSLKFQNSENLFFRTATPEDIPAFLAIEREIYAEIPWTYRHFYAEVAENARAVFILAENSEKILAYIGLRWDKKMSEAHISNFIVRKLAQKQGIGGQLLGYAEELANSLKISRLSLEVRRSDLRVQGYYRKRGFESFEILSNYYNDGDDAVAMRKELGLES